MTLLKVTGKEISHFEVNIKYQAIILLPIKTILTTNHYMSITMFPKSLISELSRAITSEYYTR